MYKIFQSNKQSVIADEINRVYQIITTDDARAIAKRTKDIQVRYRESLYTSIDYLLSVGYTKGMIVI